MWFFAENQVAIAIYIFHYKQIGVKLLGTIGLIKQIRCPVISKDF